jgi:malic enzyme
VPPTAIAASIAVLDSVGLVVADRPGLDVLKSEVALDPAVAAGYGLQDGAGLLDTVRAIRPTVLIGATGHAGSFDGDVLGTMAAGCERPIVMPLSNPTSAAEATPATILAATAGRALVATGSPFPPVVVDGRPRVVGQANNVFVFPGIGLGALVAETRRITDAMFLSAARALAALVTDADVAAGSLYPPIHELRAAARAIAVAVVTEAGRAGLAEADVDDPAAAVDAATWWPAYPTFVAEAPVATAEPAGSASA